MVRISRRHQIIVEIIAGITVDCIVSDLFDEFNVGKKKCLIVSRAAPSSPGNQRKLLYATRGLKTGSVDLPDEVEKSLSSASTSPCPSPVRQIQVPAMLPFANSIWQFLKS